MQREDYAYNERDEMRAASDADRFRPQPSDDAPELPDVPWERRR